MHYLQKEVGIKVGMEELKVSLDDIGEREFLGRYDKQIIYIYETVKEQTYFKSNKKISQEDQR